MNNAKELPLGKQVLFAFGVLCTILLVIAGLFLFSLRSIERDNQAQQSRALHKLALIDDTVQDIGQLQAAVLRQVLASDIGEMARLDQAVRDTEKTNASELTAYQAFVDTPEERRLYDKVMQARRTYWEQTQPVLSLGRANQDAEAMALINTKQAPAYDELLRASNELIDDVKTSTQDAATTMARFISRIRLLGDILAVLAIFIALGTGVAVARIARRLKDDNQLLYDEVTERKRAEETLRRSEEKFLQLASSISDVFWICSPDFQTIYYVSPGYELIWGRSIESLYARPHQWVEAILPEERERVFAVFSTLAGDEPDVSVEYRIARPDGVVRWVHDRGFQVRDAAGNLVRISGIATDITERKRTEESLRESEEKFRQLAENIVDVFWMTSPDLQTIHYVSPAYEQIWGRTAESVYANPREWADAIVPEERERVLAVFGKLADGEPSVSVEFQIVRPDGAVRWILSRGYPVRDSEGKLVRLTGIATDITERKRVEEHLFQSQKMETVAKLAGGVAHEFNSIMTAIIGQSEMMLGDLPSGNPLCKNAQEIRQAADRAALLTRQLLAYGRKQILQPKILDLNKLVVDMDGMLRHLMGEDVDVRIVPFAGLKPVKIDAGQIEQVIMNVAMNAADAMPNGGKLTLETANVTLDEEYVSRFPDLKAGEYVMLAISDTGAGMSDKVKARLFEPFFTTKDVGKGTGLGLATCQGIVKQSGGHIAVYSESGRGATFKIYLPQVEQPMKSPAPRRDSADLPHGTESILVVEDDPALREMSATLLRRLGYTVLAAANGVEALNLTQRQGMGHIDLLFTDVVMPQMSGKELSDRIQAVHPDTKVLFASAYTESAIVHQGVLDESVVLLQKPFTPSALASKVREILNTSNKE